MLLVVGTMIRVFSFKRVLKHLQNRVASNKCHHFYLENVPALEVDDLIRTLHVQRIADKAIDKKLVPPPPVKMHHL